MDFVADSSRGDKINRLETPDINVQINLVKSNETFLQPEVHLLQREKARTESNRLRGLVLVGMASQAEKTTYVSLTESLLLQNNDVIRYNHYEEANDCYLYIQVLKK